MLITYIKEESPYTMGDVAKHTLGITYSNFQKRLSKNNIKLYELEKILTYLGLEIHISLGKMKFTNAMPSPANYEEQLAQKDRVLELQEKIIYLQEKLQSQKIEDHTRETFD